MISGISIEELKRYEPFRSLKDAENKALLPLCRRESYEVNDVIIREGTRADKFYVVEKGRIALEMRIQFGAQAIGRQATTEIVEVGEYFGWSALVPPYIYTWSGTCIEPARVIAIDGEKLRQLIEENPHLGYCFMATIAGTIATRLIRTRDTLIHTLSILSHDLKSPLVAVESYLEVIAGGYAGEVNDEQRDMLQHSIRRIHELLDLISDILDISRIETGRLELEFKPMSLVAVARKSLEDIERLAKDKGVSLDLKFPEGEANMVGASGRLLQVFNNLLSNAVTYTPPGGVVKLSISDRGENWQVEVCDSGIGIPPEDIDYIFQDFFRASNVEVKGSGLGLAIASKIVAAHSGRIWAESPCPETGVGTKLAFTVPKNLKPYVAKAKEVAKA